MTLTLYKIDRSNNILGMTLFSMFYCLLYVATALFIYFLNIFWIHVTKTKKTFVMHKNLFSTYVLPSLKALAWFSNDNIP